MCIEHYSAIDLAPTVYCDDGLAAVLQHIEQDNGDGHSSDTLTPQQQVDKEIMSTQLLRQMQILCFGGKWSMEDPQLSSCS